MTDLYIASCCETGGIYHFLLDQTGLHEADVCPLDRPMYLALRNDKLYALLRDPEKTGQSGLVCATLDVTGKPTLQSEITATQGTVGCHLAVTDRGVFVANYVSGSVFRTPNRLVTHSGKGFRPDRQEKAHTHCTVLTPDGQYICVADLGLDKIFVYDLELQPVSTVSVPDGSGPRHIAFTEDGRFMYCVCELSSEVCRFSYQDGHLTLLDRASALPSDYSGNNLAAAIRIRNNLLYTSNRGHNSISVFAIGDHAPRLLETVSCGGKGPRDFDITGDLLVCTNENSGTVTFFRLEQGLPRPLPYKLEIPNALCVVFRPR